MVLKVLRVLRVHGVQKKKKDKFENVLNSEDKIVGFNINYLNNYANV